MLYFNLSTINSSVSGRMAAVRLGKELMAISKDPPPNCSAGFQNDDPFHWIATMKGPPYSPFENALFQLDFKFPTDYPFKPPTVKFLTPVWHPNIATSGGICVDVLKTEWAPTMNVAKVLISINALLVDPNPDSPLNGEAARLYKSDRAAYDRKVREFVVANYR